VTDILNDVEQAAVTAFYANEGMRESVKKVLLAALYTNGTLKPGVTTDPLKNLALVHVSQHPELSDEQVGANLRALYHGINALEVGFNNLANYKKVEPKEKKENKAR
jgi:hypothetical protein